jgi:hypothetical protein
MNRERKIKTKEEKDQKMKTLRINKLAGITGLALGMALVVSMTATINADELTFKGGAQKLMSPPAAAVIPSAAKTMACPKCVTQWVGRQAVEMKATAPRTQLVARHLCGGCETTIATVGQGKQARDVATHKCGSCGGGSLACCATTKGMEMK